MASYNVILLTKNPPISTPSPQIIPQQQPPSNMPDLKKRRLIIQQLALLMHAHQCQRRQTQSNEDNKECILPHCKTMKNILKHMASCQAGKSCNFPHCTSSKQIISHWKHCTRSNCPVCLPLRSADKGRNNATNILSTNQQTTAQNQLLNNNISAHGDPNLTRPPLTPNMALDPTTNSVIMAVSQANMQSQSSGSNAIQPTVVTVSNSFAINSHNTQNSILNANLSLPSVHNRLLSTQISGTSNLPASGNVVASSQAILNAQLSSASSLPTSGNAPNSNLNANLPLPSVENRLLNAQIPGTSNLPASSDVVASSQALLNAARISGANTSPTSGNVVTSSPALLGVQLTSANVAASSQSSNKEWHDQINQELREHLMRKIMQAIVPNNQAQVGQGPDSNRRAGGVVIEDRIMHNLETYARKVESDIFETATSKAEYYHLLVEKYYTIQEDLRERKQKRREEQQQREQQQSFTQPPTPQSQF